ALLCEVTARSFAADVLADSEVPKKLDVRANPDQADEESRDQHPKSENGEPLRWHQAFAAVWTSASASWSSARECDPFMSTVSPRRTIRCRSMSASARSATWYVSRSPAARA